MRASAPLARSTSAGARYRVNVPEQLGFTVPDDVNSDIQLVVRTPNGDAHAEGRFRVTNDRRPEPVR